MFPRRRNIREREKKNRSLSFLQKPLPMLCFFNQRHFILSFSLILFLLSLSLAVPNPLTLPISFCIYLSIYISLTPLPSLFPLLLHSNLDIPHTLLTSPLPPFLKLSLLSPLFFFHLFSGSNVFFFPPFTLPFLFFSPCLSCTLLTFFF